MFILTVSQVTTPNIAHNTLYDDLRRQVSLEEALWPVNILPSKVQVDLNGAAAILEKSFSNTRELQPPRPIDILRTLRAVGHISRNLINLVGSLEAPWNVGLEPLRSLRSTIIDYLDAKASVASPEHQGMQGCIEQARDILPIAINTLLEIIANKKVALIPREAKAIKSSSGVIVWKWRGSRELLRRYCYRVLLASTTKCLPLSTIVTRATRSSWID